MLGRNNLRNVEVDIPKRRLPIFTGVSGAGKSSLVFGTIAVESQRLINETYSALVQGFMPWRDRRRHARRAECGIIVDPERGANAWSTVGTATDAHALLRIVFSRLGRILRRWNRELDDAIVQPVHVEREQTNGPRPKSANS